MGEITAWGLLSRSTERDRRPAIASALALTAVNLFQSVPAAISILTDHLTLVKTAVTDPAVAHLVSADDNSILRNMRAARRTTELAGVDVCVPDGELKLQLQPVPRSPND